MNVLTLVLTLIPTLSLASPPPGVVMLEGSCTIERATGAETVPLHINFGSRLHVLGYKGDDGGDYEINIANNGGSRFETEQGSVQIGFARANAVVRNPPIMCPRGPEEARRACEERNLRENPPFVPAPTTRFTRLPNTTGTVKYEFLGSNPDNFSVTQIIVPRAKLEDYVEVEINTPRAPLGGVKASCALKATKI